MEWTTNKSWHKTIDSTEVYMRFKEGFLCMDAEELFTESGLVVNVGGYEGYQEHLDKLAKAESLMAALIRGAK